MCALRRYDSFADYHFERDAILCKDCKEVRELKEECPVCHKV
jgi:hypothetical protein